MIKVKIENLKHIPLSHIFKNINTKLVADTTQSRLRRGTIEIKEFITEIKSIVNDISYLKEKDYCKNNNIRIDYSTITITDEKDGHQMITDGWSRLTQGTALVCAYILYFYQNQWDITKLKKYLKNDSELKFEFLDDVGVGETLQVNSLVEYICSNQIQPDYLQQLSEEEGSLQHTLFSQQVIEIYNDLETWNLSTPDESIKNLDNILDTFWTLPKFVLPHTNREKTFVNINLKQKHLTPDCEDSIIAYNDCDKFGLPSDNRIYYVIDEYVQSVAYHIKKHQDISEGDNWFYYVTKSQNSDLYLKRNQEDNRKKFREDILNKISEVYKQNKNKLNDSVILQIKKSLKDLPYEKDFEKMAELHQLKLKKVWWSLYLRLHKNDKLTKDVEKLIYLLSQLNLFISPLWKNWDTDWLEPLLKDKKLLNKPFDTIYDRLIEATNKNDYPYPLVGQLIKNRVNLKITTSKRKPLSFIDDLTSEYLVGRYPKASSLVSEYMNNEKKEQNSIEHVHSQTPIKDLTKKCLDMGGNQFFCQKWDNSRYGNLDYTDKRDVYQKEVGQLPYTLNLFQFGTKYIQVNKNIKKEIEQLFENWDVSTLSKWNTEIRKENDNVFTDAFTIIFNDMFKKSTLKKLLKTR